MQSLIAFGLAASAALVGAEASAPVAPPAANAVWGRVVFTGALPAAPADHTGAVKFKGEKPELKPLVIEEAKSEGCVHEGDRRQRPTRP